jgi:predicted small metal-binding protein
MEEKRKIIDCRWFPSDNKCSLAISGKEEEVLKAATEHAVRSHGHKDTLELKEELRKMLKDAKD